MFFKNLIKLLLLVIITQTEVLLSTEISGLNKDTENKGSRRTEEEKFKGRRKVWQTEQEWSGSNLKLYSLKLIQLIKFCEPRIAFK